MRFTYGILVGLTLVAFGCAYQANNNVSSSQNRQSGPTRFLGVSKAVQDVVITTRSILFGTAAQWIKAFMTSFCDGDTDPATQFFQCLNNTEVPKLWASAGLNSTSFEVETNQTVSLIGEDAIVDTETLLTVLNNNQINLTDLLKEIELKLPEFCLNVDPLVNCVKPFFENCASQDNKVFSGMSFGDNAQDRIKSSASAGNEVVSATGKPENMQKAGRWISDFEFSESNLDSKSDLSPSIDDTNVNDTEWENANLPLLTSPENATQFIKEALKMLCQNNADKLTTVVDNIPCIINAVSNMTCDDEKEKMDNVTGQKTNSTAQDLCSALQDLGHCATVNVADSCQNDQVSGIIREVGGIYKNVANCHESAQVEEKAAKAVAPKKVLTI